MPDSPEQSERDALNRSERIRRAKKLAAFHDGHRAADATPAGNQSAATIGPVAKTKIRSSDITGLKFFDKLAPLLERLHDDGCQRDTANNRKLHYDQYCMLMLLYLFNPIVTSLRGIQQASELKKVQKKLGCPRASLGSLSEATSVLPLNDCKALSKNLASRFNLWPTTPDSRILTRRSRWWTARC